MGDALELRLARLEAEAGCRRLAARYAIALDTRDMDELASLYHPGIAPDPTWGPGPEGEAARIANGLKTFYRSFHLVSTHRIDVAADGASATGSVYTRAIHEIGDRWAEMVICYRDAYVRHEGEWLFARRRGFETLYNADMERGPGGGPYNLWPPHIGEIDTRNTMPQSAPTWAEFWSAFPPEHIAALTHYP